MYNCCLDRGHINRQMGNEQMSVLELVIYLYCKTHIKNHTLNCILHPEFFLKIRLNQVFSYIFMLKHTDSPQVLG